MRSTLCAYSTRAVRAKTQRLPSEVGRLRRACRPGQLEQIQSPVFPAPSKIVINKLKLDKDREQILERFTKGRVAVKNKPA